MRRVEYLKRRLRTGNSIDFVSTFDPLDSLCNGMVRLKKGRLIEVLEGFIDSDGQERGFYHSFTAGWFKGFCAARCNFNGVVIDYEREVNLGRLIQEGECIGELRFSSGARVFYRGNVELFVKGCKYADLILPASFGFYSWDPIGGDMLVNVKLSSGSSFGVRCAGFGGEFISDGKQFFADDSDGKRLHAWVVAGCIFCLEMAV